jgi:asparagine synthase (glutamine-hydrolysing)
MVEFAATLPQSCKIGAGGGKSLLRRAVRGVVPDPIIDRPKKGFPIPISSWLRTSLRQFTADHLLASDAACNQYLDGKQVSRLVQAHTSAAEDRSQEIWTLLVFEFWHRHFIEGPARPSDIRPEAQRAICGEPS